MAEQGSMVAAGEVQMGLGAGGKAYFFGVSRDVANVSASQSVVLGSTGAVGDWLESLLVVPATTSPGAVSIQDGAAAPITVFAGGATSIADLRPFSIPVRAASKNGAWKVTTGANVSVVASGSFT